MLRCFVLLLCAYGAVGYGYDSGGGDQASCGRPYRTGRNYQPPCDLSKYGYCVQAGQLYPWRAVRKFVKDNQGLMRRMYGDQRQGHLLRAELDSDLVDEEWGQPTRHFNEWREPLHRRYSKHQQDFPEEELDMDNELSPIPHEAGHYEEPRYLREDSNTVVDVLKTKFVYSQHEPAVVIKLAGLKAASRYRATTQRTTTTTSKLPTTEKTTTTKSYSSRTIPPRTTNPKNIYSARNTVTTTKKPTTFRSMTINKLNLDMRRSTTSGTTPKSRSTHINSVGTTKKAVYITRDSASSKPNTVGKNESTTTEFTSTTGTTESTMVTTASTSTEDIAHEFTTDTTASSDQSSTTTKVQPSTTKPSTLVADDRLSGEDDTVKVLNEKSSVGVSDNSVEELKIASDSLTHNENTDETDSGKDDEMLPLEDDVSLEEDKDDDSKSNDDVEESIDADTSASETHEHKVDTMLFQDMADDTNKKVTVNYNMKGVNACPVKEEVVAPFWANNTRGEVLALLNMYPFEQYVHWEKCTFEHRQMYCREGCRCEQQYRLHRLLAYDPNNECRGIFSDWFRFPSCCVCKCYNLPAEFRVTSRSPRLQRTFEEDENWEYDENIA